MFLMRCVGLKAPGADTPVSFTLYLCLEKTNRGQCIYTTEIKKEFTWKGVKAVKVVHVARMRKPFCSLFTLLQL